MMETLQSLMLKGGVLVRRVYEGHVYYYITAPDGSMWHVTYAQYLELLSTLKLEKIAEDKHARTQKFAIYTYRGC
ncbi:hypothetical protein ANRL4_01492 [Anaerolineae bacterium]|nr:hypothetical protein ANRL4_01492 [Anaerolineae bacterium]